MTSSTSSSSGSVKSAPLGNHLSKLQPFNHEELKKTSFNMEVDIDESGRLVFVEKEEKDWQVVDGKIVKHLRKDGEFVNDPYTGKLREVEKPPKMHSGIKSLKIARELLKYFSENKIETNKEVVLWNLERVLEILKGDTWDQKDELSYLLKALYIELKTPMQISFSLVVSSMKAVQKTYDRAVAQFKSKKNLDPKSQKKLVVDTSAFANLQEVQEGKPIGKVSKIDIKGDQSIYGSSGARVVFRLNRGTVSAVFGSSRLAMKFKGRFHQKLKELNGDIRMTIDQLTKELLQAERTIIEKTRKRSQEKKYRQLRDELGKIKNRSREQEQEYQKYSQLYEVLHARHTQFLQQTGGVITFVEKETGVAYTTTHGNRAAFIARKINGLWKLIPLSFDKKILDQRIDTMQRLQKGDIIIQASRRFYDYVTPGQVLKNIKSYKSHSQVRNAFKNGIAKRLVGKALAGMTKDQSGNVTVVTMQIS